MPTVEQIVNEAIPNDSCPRREAAAKNRRKILANRIENVIQNAWYHKDDVIQPRDKTQPYMPPLKYKREFIDIDTHNNSKIKNI